MKMLAFKDMPYTRPDMDAMKKALAEATEKLRPAGAGQAEFYPDLPLLRPQHHRHHG